MLCSASGITEVKREQACKGWHGCRELCLFLYSCVWLCDIYWNANSFTFFKLGYTCILIIINLIIINLIFTVVIFSFLGGIKCTHPLSQNEQDQSCLWCKYSATLAAPPTRRQDRPFDWSQPVWHWATERHPPVYRVYCHRLSEAQKQMFFVRTNICARIGAQLLSAVNAAAVPVSPC